ncbi:helix-turn-helix domain-containing protein [Nocardia sp. 004]|uniref:helix-turn-helix domain-containing protein n=1 Tax=Nocardia sp. 004 TaxID=3385978 RepID=UPI0039A2B6C2
MTQTPTISTHRDAPVVDIVSHRQLAEESTVAEVSEHLHRAVARAICFMRDNLAEPITADEIARTALFSKYHFTRVFQRVTGDSPGRYLTELRFERARELLLSTDLKVVDISYEVGFASVGTFSTRFRERTGVSPSAFRQHFRTTAPRTVYERLPVRSKVA